MTALLETDGLTKRFGGLTAVDGLSLHIDESEILGIIGPNGAGKSTVLNMICGFFPATSGKIVFSGRDITRLKAHRVAALGISRNFQSSLLFMDLSVLDNVFMAYHMSYRANLLKTVLRLPSAKTEERALKQRGEEVLDSMGMSAVKHELATNLPHGLQRTLGVCIALATNPKLLLLDEPMTGMNQNEIQTMVGLVRNIRDAGITIAMIEHNVDAVMSLCDRVVVLNYGKKIAEGSPQEVREDAAVIEAYLGTE